MKGGHEGVPVGGDLYSVGNQPSYLGMGLNDSWFSFSHLKLTDRRLVWERGRVVWLKQDVCKV